jgi:trk system potassium uptake protein TrkA
MNTRRTVLVVGAGNAGYFLAKSLLREGFKVVLAERDAARAEKLVDELGVDTFVGEGTDPGILEAASAGLAECVVAMTGNDDTNLAICQVVKRQFGVKTTIARIMDPRNEELFERLGVNGTVCASGLVVKMLGTQLQPLGRDLLVALESKGTGVLEFAVDRHSPGIGKPVSELQIPAGCLLIAIQRLQELLIPHGTSRLEPGDRVYALVTAGQEEAFRMIFPEIGKSFQGDLGARGRHAMASGAPNRGGYMAALRRW